MINVSDALKNRIANFMRSNTSLRAKYTAMSNPAELWVEDAKYFHIAFAMRNEPQYKIQVGNAQYRVKVIDVNLEENSIRLEEPIDVDLPVGTKIFRAPNYEWVGKVMLGDPPVLAAGDYPCICIVPESKKHSWQTFSYPGTQERMSYSIITHILMDNDFERKERAIQRITEDLEDLLNADLHLYVPDREREGDNRIYNSLVESVEYGYSYKGKQFLRSSKISWFGEEFWIKKSIVTDRKLTSFD